MERNYKALVATHNDIDLFKCVRIWRCVYQREIIYQLFVDMKYFGDISCCQCDVTVISSNKPLHENPGSLASNIDSTSFAQTIYNLHTVIA